MGVKINKKNKILLMYSLILIIAIISGAAYEDIVNDKNNQLNYSEKQVRLLRENIDENNLKLNSVKKQINNIESGINDLNSFLKNYEDETYMTPEQIAIETNIIIYLAEEVDRIQESFKKKVINLYKHGKNYELELLFSAKSPNEYLRRNQYLQIFSQNRKKELRELKSKKFILEEKKKMLNLSTSSQRFYVEARRNEKASLTAKLNSLTVLKTEIEDDNNMVYEKISRYETQITRIENYLGNLESNKEKFTGNKRSRINYDSDDLSSVKGNLNSPLDAGLLFQDFGNYVNNQTNTVSFNNGANFSVVYGSKVHAIASGVVTIVGDLPFYGKCVIIKHGNGFRTVYASLSESSVSPGDLVKLNQVIGRSGENFDGQMLHFELLKT